MGGQYDSDYDACDCWESPDATRPAAAHKSPACLADPDALEGLVGEYPNATKSKETLTDDT